MFSTQWKFFNVSTTANAWRTEFSSLPLFCIFQCTICCEKIWKIYDKKRKKLHHCYTIIGNWISEDNSVFLLIKLFKGYLSYSILILENEMRKLISTVEEWNGRRKKIPLFVWNWKILRLQGLRKMNSMFFRLFIKD